MKGNFKGYIRNGDRLSEPTLNLEDPEFFWIGHLLFFDIPLYFLNGFDNILDSGKRTFSSDHITDGELKFFFIL